MTEHEIGSVVLDDTGPRRDLETFAVCYDFLAKVDRRFLASQRRAFMLSGAALCGGAALTIASFFTELPLMVPGAAMAVAGAIGYGFFFTRSPRGMSCLKKVFRPLALVPVGSSSPDKMAMLDCTGMVWQKNLSMDLSDHARLDATLTSLPMPLVDHDDEVRALSDLRSLDSFKESKALNVAVAAQGKWAALVELAAAVDGPPARSMPGMEWSEAEKVGQELGEMLEASSAEIEYIEGRIEAFNDIVAAYLHVLEEMYRLEVDHSCNELARLASETERSPRFFDPLINSFLEDARDGLTMVEKASQRELDVIESRLQLDQSYIDLLLDRMHLNVRLERERMRREGGLRENRLGSLDKLAETILKARETNLRPMSPGLAETMRTARPIEQEREDLGQRLLDRAQGGAGIGVFIEQMGNIRKIAPEELAFLPSQPAETAPPGPHLMADPLTESQLKRYDAIMKRSRTFLDDIARAMGECSDDLGELADDLRGKVEADIKRVDAQLLSGKRAVTSADITKEEDYQRVRREVDRLEDVRSYVIEMMVQAEGMMIEGAARHLRPLAERAHAFESERARIEDLLRGIIDSCSSCQRSIDAITVQAEGPGRYHVPYWILKYEAAGGPRTHIYPVCGLDEQAVLRPKFPELSLEPEQMVRLCQEKGGVDLGLVSDISKSKKACRQKAPYPWLDSLIVEWGVRRLGKAE